MYVMYVTMFYKVYITLQNHNLLSMLAALKANAIV